MEKTPDGQKNASKRQAKLKERLNTLMRGQTIQSVAIWNERELVIFFESGDRLFVNAQTELDVSVT